MSQGRDAPLRSEGSRKWRSAWSSAPSCPCSPQALGWPYRWCPWRSTSPASEGALLVGLYLLYLGANLRYLALLIRGDFS